MEKRLGMMEHLEVRYILPASPHPRKLPSREAAMLPGEVVLGTCFVLARFRGIGVVSGHRWCVISKRRMESVRKCVNACQLKAVGGKGNRWHSTRVEIVQKNDEAIVLLRGCLLRKASSGPG